MTAAAPAVHRTLYQVLSLVVAFLTPIALVLTAVRILLTPAFPRFEYAMPGFPPDPYGFTLQDRLYWSRYAVEYLVNDAGIEYLGDLRFTDGSRVYNDRELRHMVDVKVAVQNTLRVWLATLAGLVALALWAWLGGWVDEYVIGLRWGGLITFWFIVVIITFVALSFGVLFVAFHNIFFQPGTWTFEWSDTLIRLFPERFWRDIFIYIGIMAGGGGLLIWWFLRRK